MPKVYCKTLLEIACFSVESCIKAQEFGADRIEFCSQYAQGGITPDYEDIIRAKKLLHIPLHVLIRPRGGIFFYTPEEIEVMKKDILFCKAQGVEGVVFGVLNEDYTIHETVNKQLVDLSKPMSITFHRAIDECVNSEDAFKKIIDLGFTRVLTSGNKSKAIEGLNQLKMLQNKFGNEIIIIPGGGIRSSNIEEIIFETTCKEYHSAAIVDETEQINISELISIKTKMTVS